jgi:predicted phage gp36 major capsid-like protein
MEAVMKSTRRTVLSAFALSITLATGFVAGKVSAEQPQMSAALTSLRDAKQHLQNATADKGGHRNKALDLVNKAINQVELGMRYDRRH